MPKKKVRKQYHRKHLTLSTKGVYHSNTHTNSFNPAMNHIRQFFFRFFAWFSRNISGLGSSSVFGRISLKKILIVAIPLLILLFLIMYRSYAPLQNFFTPNSPVTPSPTPTPYPVNFHGKMEFSISTGRRTGPIFVEGSLDPFDVTQGKEQKLTVYISDTTPITEVSATWETDTKKQTVPLTLKEGTKNKGWWEATWVASDTYLYKLNINLTATDGKETNSALMTWR